MLKDIQTIKAELNVGESTVRRWVREGILPVVRLGRRVLIRQEDLRDFVDRAADTQCRTAAAEVGQQCQRR